MSFRLHAKGYRVTALQNPLTSSPDDIDRTSKLVAAQDGPTLLVGHIPTKEWLSPAQATRRM
jgi:hypothetical protein